MPRESDTLPYGMVKGSTLHDLHNACLGHGFKKDKESRWGMVCERPRSHPNPKGGYCLFKYRLYTKKREDRSLFELAILHHEPDNRYEINVSTRQPKRQPERFAQCLPTTGHELEDLCKFLDDLPA